MGRENLETDPVLLETLRCHYNSLGRDDDIKYTSMLDPGAIKPFKEAGIEVNVWTVDNPEDAEKLMKAGVDYITSNILE